MAEFQFLLENNSYITYNNWEDIPENLIFRNIIKFIPDIPEEPHTEDEHEIMSLWNERLQDLIKKEKN